MPTYRAPKPPTPDEPHRNRLKRREIHLGERYLTCSCYHRLALFADDTIKDEFVEVLGQARDRHAFRLLAWVLMPEHFHLLLVPTSGLGTGSAVPSILIGIKKTLSDRALRRWRTVRHPILSDITEPTGKHRFWQPGGGFDRNIRNGEELAKTISYIHNNPVERGLAKQPTDWKWSSARWRAGLHDGALPLDSGDFRLPGPGRPDLD